MRHFTTLIVFALLALLLDAASAPAQSFLGKTPDEWAAKLGAGNDVKTRRNAAFALGKIGPRARDYAGGLLTTLTDSDPAVREASAYALGEVYKNATTKEVTQQVLDGLCRALAADNNDLVKRSAAFALGNIGQKSPQVQKALIRAFDDLSPAVKQNVAWAMGRVGDPTGPTLRKALRDNDANVRRDAAGSLQLLSVEAAEEAVPDLIACMKHEDAEVRKAAALAVVKLVNKSHKDLAPELGRALTDKDLDIRFNAASALSNIGGEEAAGAVPVLIEALRKGDPEMRRQAAACFNNLGPVAVDAVDELRKALRDKDTTVRQYAAVGLTGIGEKAQPAIPDLVQVLADKGQPANVRVASATALSRIGKNATADEAVPQLLRVLEDAGNDVRVRERTLWALRVHKEQMLKLPGVSKALTRILTQPKVADSKMLRYDCAFLLGVFEQHKAPNEALDVLLDFLRDPDVKIYQGVKVVGPGVGGEKPGGKADVKDSGQGDGRVMAVQALEYIGRDRVGPRKDIMRQLQVIEEAPDTTDVMRGKVKDLLKKLK